MPMAAAAPATTTTRPATAARVMMSPCSSRLSLELDAVLDQLLVSTRIEVVLGADVFLEPRALSQHQRRRQLPRLRQHLRIFYRHFVVDAILADAGEALGEVQVLGMKRAGAGEPGLVVEAGDVDN